MGPSPTRSDRASRSLLRKPPVETLSSGFQVLPCRSRQEDGGKLSCSRPLEEEGVGPWQEEEAGPSQEADSSTPSCQAGCTICAFEGGRRGTDPCRANFCICWSQALKGRRPFFQPLLDFIAILSQQRDLGERLAAAWNSHCLMHRQTAPSVLPIRVTHTAVSSPPLWRSYGTEAQGLRHGTRLLQF